MKIKKLYIFLFVILTVLISAIVAASYFLTEKNIKNIIRSEFFNATGYRLNFKNFSFSLQNGASCNFSGISLEDNSSQSVSKIENLSFTLKILPLFSKKIIFQNIKLYNAHISYILTKNMKRTQKTGKTEKSEWILLSENIDIKNVKADIKIPKHNISANISKLNLKNFSFNKEFVFDLKSSLSVDNETGKIYAHGTFFLPENKISLTANAFNLNLSFLKKFGIGSSNCNLFFSVNGNFKEKSNVSLKMENIRFTKFNNLNHKIYIKTNYVFSGKTLELTDGKAEADNNVFINFHGKIQDFDKFIFKLKTEPIKFSYIKQYIKKETGILLGENGKFMINNLSVSGSLKQKSELQINTDFNFIKCNALCKNYPVKNISFNGSFKNNKLIINNLKATIKNSKIKNLNISYNKGILEGSGKLFVDVSNLPVLDRNLSLKKGMLNINLAHFKIPVQNFEKTNLRYKGKFDFSNGLISYDIFKNIKVKKLIGEISDKTISLKKGEANFRGINYILSGTVKHYLKNPVKLEFTVSSDTFDSFIAQKVLHLRMNGCKNILAKVNLKGGIDNKNGFKLYLKSGMVNFKNSNVDIYGYKISKINGEADFTDNIVTIKSLTFNYNKGTYHAKGTITSPFNKHSINLNVSSNVLDEKIAGLIKIKRLENLDIHANLTGSFDKITIKSAKVALHGTNFDYDKYHVKNMKGSVIYKNNVVTLKNITCTMNNIDYIANGKIFYPFENISYSLHVKTDTIDSMFLKEAHLKLPTIKNVDAKINVSGKIGKNFTIQFNHSVIRLNNTSIGKAESLLGEIILCKNKVEFNNISGKFYKGSIRVNGYLTTDGAVKKGYFSINGENFDFSKINAKKPAPALKKKHKKTTKNNKPSFMEKIYNFCKNINIHISSNFDNVTSSTQTYKNINLDLSIDKKGIVIKNCKLLTDKNGFFKVEKGSLVFGKTNEFTLKISYNKLNIGDIFDFLIPRKNFEFYGKAKNCHINIKSRFKKFNEFEKALNGKFNIDYKDGFVNKVPTVANIFSILNISQIFKFKLPDLNQNGFNYHALKGDFSIKNGIISTKLLKLESDSINLVYFGDINLVKKEYNANLAVYPLKTVDTILKYIPVIGYLFRDKKGHTGVVVTYFSIKGPLDNPSISMLPASTVTKKVGNILENIIKLPFSIITKPGSVIIPKD
jgi:hypothetical protein